MAYVFASSLADSTRAAAVAELRRRLPRLIFAALDAFPLADGLLQATDANQRRFVVLAVCSTPGVDRLDAGVAATLDQLVCGTKRPDASARQLHLTFPAEKAGDHEEIHLVVNWHDCVDFNRLLLKSLPSCVEVLALESGSKATLFSTQEWDDLRANLSATSCSPETLSSCKPYLKACFGAAQSLLCKAVGRKGRGGYSESSGAVPLLTPETAEVVERLCARVATAGGLPAAKVELADQLSLAAWTQLLQDLSGITDAAPPVPSKNLALCLDTWCDGLRAAEFRPFAAALGALAAEFEASEAGPLEAWRQQLAAAGFQAAALAVAPAAAPGAFEDAEERTALAEIQGLLPEGSEMALLAQTGSYMYDLQVDSSDRDFTLLFLADPELLLSLSPPREEFSRHLQGGFGSDKRGEVEYSGRELGSFVALLAKGNPRNVEMLFSEKPALRGWAWEELRASRACFLTLRCASQYLGFISERLHRVAGVLEAAEAQEAAGCSSALSHSRASQVSKLLYHAHHEMADLGRVLRGSCPIVALKGEERQRVLQLRLQRPQSVAEVKQLLADAESQRAALAAELHAATEAKHLPAEVEAKPLLAWLRSVRARSAKAKSGTDAPSAGPPADLVARPAAAKLIRTRSEDAVEAIRALLGEVEVAEGIRIVVAGYTTSSRVLGTAHTASDHDIKCIFVHPRSHYFGLRPLSRTFKHQFPGAAAGADVEISGWDAQHALQMLADNNPSVLGMLLSPLSLVGRDWSERLLEAAAASLNRRSLMIHWFSHGRQNYESSIKSRETPLRKRYVHVVRPLLCVAWTRRSRTPGSGLWPPLLVSDLVAQTASLGAISAEEADAVARFLLANLEDLPRALPRVPELDALVQRLLQDERPPAADEWEAVPPEAAENWDRLCIELIGSQAPQ
ncbi:unnamed protein product [Polarella glacialis]|uniref:Uncharacterized protein n=1 Tax=Polarella glacialis TaxID=89957 RepID=A0A813FFK1_POLGL|nr:unnamed protein product [Polarella glacialis]